MKHRILIVDDNPLDLEALEFLLKDQGYQIRSTVDSEEGLAFLRQNKGKLSLAIIDYNLPGTNGAILAKQFSEIDSSLQIATYSGDTSDAAFESTMSAGSRYFIQKGMEPKKLLSIINTFCTRHEEANKTIAEFPVTDDDQKLLAATGMTGRSANIVKTAKLIHTFAKDDETVLIRGENGTGKELVARAVHNLSSRRGPFIPVNCGAIPFDLLESELFGHEKGSFSGAIRSKTGLVTAANNGTIFLDEIGDLPLLLQVKILRFLQEGEVRPVGSESTIKVNTRVICATNADLETAVAENRFRQDLYYRINVLPIPLSPLRDRREDVAPLVLRFSKMITAEKGIGKEFLEETVKVMASYQWPGNIRELEHEVRRTMLLAKGDKITPKDLDPRIRGITQDQENKINPDLDYETFRERQVEEERRYILAKVQSAKSVRILAKDILKISNSTLQRRLRELGIVFQNSNKKGGLKYEA
jgi:DNA-binding NtrC family response regulator